MLPLDLERVTANVQHMGGAVHLRCVALYRPQRKSKLAYLFAVVTQEARALQDPRVLGALHTTCLQVC